MSDQQAVIFDLDGVLVDSYAAHFESWRQLCAERGWEMSVEQFASTFGQTSREIIRRYWGQEVQSDAEVATLDHRKESLFREILAGDFPVMEGAVVLIDHLQAGGFALAIGSSAPPENVHLSLDCLQRRTAFDAVVTAADVRRGKPDPQVFLLAAERLQVPPGKCVVVEDAPIGVQAAHAAGMKCIGYASTGRTREQLSTAELIIGRLGELRSNVIRNLLTT